MTESSAMWWTLERQKVSSGFRPNGSKSRPSASPVIIMNQLDRDKRAIRTVLEQMGEATYPELALQAGEGLCETLCAMSRRGEVERVGTNPMRFKLPPVENPALDED